MTMFQKLAMTLFAVSLMIGGCTKQMTSNVCDGWKPIRPAGEDSQTISSELAHQIVAHNRFGQQNCRWSP